MKRKINNMCENEKLSKTIILKLDYNQYQKLLKIIAYDYNSLSMSAVLRLLINDYHIKNIKE